MTTDRFVTASLQLAHDVITGPSKFTHTTCVAAFAFAFAFVGAPPSPASPASVPAPGDASSVLGESLDGGGGTTTVSAASSSPTSDADAGSFGRMDEPSIAESPLHAPTAAAVETTLAKSTRSPRETTIEKS